MTLEPNAAVIHIGLDSPPFSAVRFLRPSLADTAKDPEPIPPDGK